MKIRPFLFALVAALSFGSCASAQLQNEPQLFEGFAAPETESTQARFVIKNRFDTLAKIVEVRPSCECLTVSLSKREIAPHGEIRVSVEMDLKDKAGPQQKSVELIFEGVKQTQLNLPISLTREVLVANSATASQPRNTWIEFHSKQVKSAKESKAEILFIGDSITAGWTSPTGGKEWWDKQFVPLKASNLGIGGDRAENVLWRLQNGALDGWQPRLIVLLIGTNNIGQNTPTEIAEGIAAIVSAIHARSPQTKIVLQAIFPRGQKLDNPMRADIRQINAKIAALDDGKTVFFVDFEKSFVEANGSLTREMMSDFLHLTNRGYGLWSQALIEKLTHLQLIPAKP